MDSSHAPVDAVQVTSWHSQLWRLGGAPQGGGASWAKRAASLCVLGGMAPVPPEAADSIEFSLPSFICDVTAHTQTGCECGVDATDLCQGLVPLHGFGVCVLCCVCGCCWAACASTTPTMRSTSAITCRRATRA